MNDSNPRNETFWILLVVAAFILGHLITKSQDLKQNQNAGQVVAQNNQNPQVSPAPILAPSAQVIPPSQAAQNLPTADNVPKVTVTDHLRGSTNAQITLVEYSDLECPYCKKFHPTLQQILKDYNGKVNWVYRHFPLPFHTNATPAALAAECANKQGGNSKFWQYIDGIFADSNPLSQEAINQVAEQIGLDQSKFTDCLQNKQFQSVVDEDLSGGQKAGINGTPGTVLINNKTGKTQLISGALPVEEIKKSIDAALVELP